MFTMPRSRSKPKSPERLAAELFGRRGETVAAWFLRLKGYRIRATRVKTPVGEIDLVAEQSGVLVFVEVKTRARGDLEAEAHYAVDRRRIMRAAQHYVSHHPRFADSTLRFDMIFLAPWTWPRHIVNAFDAS
jgi:putative endonuclease